MPKIKFFFLLRFLFMCSFSFGALPENLTYLVVTQHENKPGMFSVFCSVAGFLDMYDKGKYAGIEVNFEDKGLYYDPVHGPNWWNYYCEPIRFGSTKRAEVKRFSEAEIGERACHTEYNLSRERVHELIEKYIKVKKNILTKVDDFVDKYFDGRYVIGIHYRGTDKRNEAPRIPYATVDHWVRECLQEGKGKKPIFFVATDEQEFLDHMIEKFPDRVVYTNSERSRNGQPVHLFGNGSPYEKGEQAIVDALLLSKCKVLIRTSSNLSLWSTYFNPNLEVILLNSKY